MINLLNFRPSLFRSLLGYICFILSFSSVTFASENTLIPPDFVKNFLKEYSQDETMLIMDDFQNIKELCFRKLTPPLKEQSLGAAT